MPDRLRRFREAVVVFVDTEAVDQADASHVARYLVKAAIGGRASQIVRDEADDTVTVTASHRLDGEVTGRVVEVETLGSAMSQQLLTVNATGRPWRHLGQEDTPDA